MKYLALSNDAGRISVEWSLADMPHPKLKLVWTELGGPTVSPPVKQGFGSRLIERGLVGDLQAEVAMELKPEGLVCKIDAPLPEGRVIQ